MVWLPREAMPAMDVEPHSDSGTSPGIDLGFPEAARRVFPAPSLATKDARSHPSLPGPPGLAVRSRGAVAAGAAPAA
ncbi:MAG: hypothetical protein GTO03_15205 [Planctomycetales bacterium]|nr:hypothetical protein [Planctomycetales bacterium]